MVITIHFQPYYMNLAGLASQAQRWFMYPTNISTPVRYMLELRKKQKEKCIAADYCVQHIQSYVNIVGATKHRVLERIVHVPDSSS